MTVEYLRREDLDVAFKGNTRLIKAFENQNEVLAATEQKAGEAESTTQAIQDATVIVMSTNATFTNERVFTPEDGIEAEEDGNLVRVRLDGTAARVEGGYSVTLLTVAPTTLLLPATGHLSTVAGIETLTNKSLEKPKIGTWGNYTNDANAAAGGVPLGGVYRNGSALMVRVV